MALLQLMSSLEANFAQQMWGFQSRLFFEKGGSTIGEVEALDIEHWHAWVGDATIADAILDRLMQKHHRFTLTGESLRQKPKPIKKEPDTESS